MHMPMLAIEIVKEGKPKRGGYDEYDDMPMPRGEGMSEMHDDITKQIVSELWLAQEKRDHQAYYDAFKAMMQCCMRNEDSY